MRPLLAGALGVACLLGSGLAWCAPPSEPTQPEIVVTARRQSDVALAASVAMAVRADPYIFGDHVTVTAENGVVRVGGLVNDLADLYAILRLARRIAGHGRVVNEIVFDPQGYDSN